MSAAPTQELSRPVKFASAGLGGCLAWAVVHPFNTAAVRLNLENASSGGGKGTTFYSFLRKNLKDAKSARGLYDGITAGFMRQIVYATSRFGLFEVFRDELATYRPTDIWSRLGAGCASGAIAAFISCPMEVTLVRLANDAALPLADRRGYKGFTDAFSRIAREEGVRAFFGASGPYVNRAILVGAVQVGTYDQFKYIYREYANINSLIPNTAAAAMTAGFIYSVATMPFESAKNRIAFQKPDPKTGELLYRSTLQTITTVAKQEGALSLYNGFFPYYLRCGGHTIFMFLFVEMLRDAYRKAMTS